MPEELREALVADLIDPQTKTWDPPYILSDLFIPDDVNRITIISISPDYEDSWYWMGNPTREYTVKNAYRRVIGDFVNSPSAFDKWVTMWKLKIPSKWKIFLWRAICDILPTTNNLIIKSVEVSLACPMCDLAHEDIMHALISCDYSRMVWNVSQLPIANIMTHSFPLWLMSMLNTLIEEQIGVAVGMLYHKWRARNSAVCDKALPRPGQTWRRAMMAENAYRQVHHRQQRPTPSVLPIAETHTRLKCFVDAGYK
ncbi:PREDICTED: uncharacterized protein LOC109155150 [Ipomoea nil]|uniref:uncharacterized protein LOC109155150 n=1 Tax=Ipomoea nil TaxID=35883 RepID=UPI0009014813|nr:PREDICTED: uncharacterized protein LOC109155150 [Ipomoea nil]